MKRIATTTALASGLAALALAAGPAAAEEQSDEEAVEVTEGEKELAKLLEGRVAGEPQSCIRGRLNKRLRVIDETAYVYGRGDTIYVQRTRHPDRIDDSDIIVQRRFNGNELCKLDVVTTVDRTGGIFTGTVFFDDFVPYTRIKDAEKSS